MSVKTASQCTFFVFTLVHSGPFHQWVYLPCGSIQNNRYYGQILGNCGLKRKTKQGSQPGNTDSWNRRWTVCRRCVAIDSQFSKLYFRGRNTIYWALCLTRLVLLPPCIAGLFSSYDDSQLFQVVLLWSEFHLLSLVSLDRFSHHHVSPASFPPIMTRSSPSCSFMVRIPSTEFCVSLDRFSYHPVSPASFLPRMTHNSPSCTFVVRILSTEPCVSLDWFSYHPVSPALPLL